MNHPDPFWNAVGAICITYLFWFALTRLLKK